MAWPQAVQAKQLGWKPLPMALTMRSVISPWHLAHFSSVAWRRWGEDAGDAGTPLMSRGHRVSCRAGYLVAGVARGAPVPLVVALPGQALLAGPAGEAVGVVLLAHRLHRRLPRAHGFVAEGADICGRGQRGGWPRCPQLGMSLHHPPAHLWSRPSPGARWHPATAVCLLAPGEIWAASAQQGRRKEPGEQEANVRYVEALKGGETEAWG